MRGLKARTNFHYPPISSPVAAQPPSAAAVLHSSDWPWSNAPHHPHHPIFLRGLASHSIPNFNACPSCSLPSSLPSHNFLPHSVDPFDAPAAPSYHLSTAPSWTAASYSSSSSAAAATELVADEGDFFHTEPADSGLLQEIVNGFRQQTVGNSSSCCDADDFPMIPQGLLEDIIQYPDFFEALSTN